MRTDRLGRAVALLALLPLATILQGCLFIGDPMSRTWVVEVYAPSETIESAAVELDELAVQAGIEDLVEDYWEEWYWAKKDLPAGQRQVHYTGQTILDRVHTGVVVVDLRRGAGIRFVFSGDADDDDSMKTVIADLMRVTTARFGSINVAVTFDPGNDSPGLLLSKWQAEERT